MCKLVAIVSCELIVVEVLIHVRLSDDAVEQVQKDEIGDVNIE